MLSTRYQKKQIFIDAVQWTTDNFGEVNKFAGNAVNLIGSSMFVITPEGPVKIGKNDWIVKHEDGQFSGCNNELFNSIFDPVRN